MTAGTPEFTNQPTIHTSKQANGGQIELIIRDMWTIFHIYSGNAITIFDVGG